MVGSRTSIIAATVALFVFVLIFPGIVFRRLKIMLAVMIFALVLGVSLYQRIYPEMSDYTLGIFRGYDGSTTTLEDREDKWIASLGFLKQSPGVLINMPNSGIPSNVAFYHNEYVGVIMVAGLIGFYLYLLGFWGFVSKAARNYFQGIGFALPQFTGVLINGLLHGWAVVHLVPGVLFSTGVFMSMMSYQIISFSNFRNVARNK
jgi:hypothetical protein